MRVEHVSQALGDVVYLHLPGQFNALFQNLLSILIRLFVQFHHICKGGGGGGGDLSHAAQNLGTSAHVRTIITLL